MNKCKDDEIINPITFRCIGISGTTVKKIIKDKTIIFSDTDKKKLQTYGIIPKTPNNIGSIKVFSPIKTQDNSVINKTLWFSDDCKLWKNTLDNYCILRNKKNPTFTEIDKWYLVTLHKNIISRFPMPFITKDEYVKLFNWNLIRIKFQKKFIKYPEIVTDKEAEQLSIDALSIIKDCNNNTNLKIIKKAFDIYKKNFGIVFASALFSIVSPYIPFMSNELLENVIGKNINFKYNWTEYRRCLEICREKSIKINISPTNIERCLFVSYYI
jgi:hypothetical protein